MRNISKKIFLEAVKCDYLGHAMRSNNEPDELTISDEFTMEEGKEVGKRARELYPGGILVSDKEIAVAVKKTKELMEDKNVSVIFEAAFTIDNYTTRADILKRTADGWQLIEVKSGTKEKPKYIEDIAYTALVIDHLGINISKISLLHLSKDYRLGMDNTNLFADEIDCTDKVLEQVELFNPLWDRIEEITRQEEEPAQILKLKCSGCDIFTSCVGEGIENHIFDLPRLMQKKYDKLADVGIVRIEDIPDGADLTENQAKVVKCVKSGEPLVGSGLENSLNSITWPAYYLDFETVKTAIPLFSDVAPHAQVPTQYSIHKCSSPTEVDDHFEYLADPSKDCRKKLAERLVNDLNGEGSIIVYTHFERERIKDLIEAVPEHAEKLTRLLDRLVDLAKIISNDFNHPKFHGKTSIKQTLPALVPGMTYDGLDISEGLTASAYFAYLALGKYSDDEAKQIKSNLLKYCKQDTLGMVKIHETLVDYI